MDAPRGVELTDTNPPCGLTIDSFCKLTTHCRERGEEELPFAGYLVVRTSCVRGALRRDAGATCRRAYVPPPHFKFRRRRRAPNRFPGGHRSRVTPVPIPNTEVKPATADGTAWVTAWESRSLPGLFSARGSFEPRAFFLPAAQRTVARRRRRTSSPVTRDPGECS